jgi:hypothetical protein
LIRVRSLQLALIPPLFTTNVYAWSTSSTSSTSSPHSRPEMAHPSRDRHGLPSPRLSRAGVRRQKRQAPRFEAHFRFDFLSPPCRGYSHAEHRCGPGQQRGQKCCSTATHIIHTAHTHTHCTNTTQSTHCTPPPPSHTLPMSSPAPTRVAPSTRWCSTGRTAQASCTRQGGTAGCERVT